MRPPTALPVVANWAACAIVSPRTSRGRMASHRPRLRRTASAALPYGATSGLAIANRSTPPRFDQPRQTVEPIVNGQGGTVGGEDHEPPDRIHGARVAREPGGRELVRKLFVRSQEHLEGRAVLNLARQRPGRAEHELHARATLARELIGYLGEREIEVRGRGNRGGTLSGQRRRPAEPEQDMKCQNSTDDEASRHLPPHCRAASWRHHELHVRCQSLPIIILN